MQPAHTLMLLLAFGACAGPRTEPKPSPPAVAIASAEPEPELPARAAAASGLVGELDESFGKAGFALFERGPSEQRFSAITVLPDGAIAGAGYAPFDGSHDIAAARIKPSGALDESFGDKGVVRVGQRRGFGGAVTHDSRGRLFVAGYFYAKSNSDLLVACLDARGRFDPSFGQGGIVTHDFGTNDSPHAMFVRPDGGLVIVGHHGGSKSAAVRLRADGSVDRSFGKDGVALFGSDSEQGAGFATAGAMASDGTIVAGGYLARAHRGFVARIDARGQPEARFGTGGVVVLDSPSLSSAWAVAADEEGRVLLGGHTDSGPAVVARFTRAGRLDPTWGQAGVATVDPSGDDQLYALLIDASGRVTGVGFRGLADEARGLVARFTSSGALDSSFAERGLLIPSSDGATFLFDASFDREGRLVAGGDSWKGSRSRALLVRIR